MAVAFPPFTSLRSPLNTKQTPGQLRIQKGACSRPAAWSARTAGPGPTRPACACCADVGDLTFKDSDGIAVEFPDPVRRDD